MSACGVGQTPGCICAREHDGWAAAYWLIVLSALGVASACLLRSRTFPAIVLIIIAVVAGGEAGMFALSLREPFDAEYRFAWYFAIAIYAGFVVILFSLVRAFRHWRRRRSP